MDVLGLKKHWSNEVVASSESCAKYREVYQILDERGYIYRSEGTLPLAPCYHQKTQTPEVCLTCLSLFY